MVLVVVHLSFLSAVTTPGYKLVGSGCCDGNIIGYGDGAESVNLCKSACTATPGCRGLNFKILPTDVGHDAPAERIPSTCALLGENGGWGLDDDEACRCYRSSDPVPPNPVTGSPPACPPPLPPGAIASALAGFNPPLQDVKLKAIWRAVPRVLVSSPNECAEKCVALGDSCAAFQTKQNFRICELLKRDRSDAPLRAIVSAAQWQLYERGDWSSGCVDLKGTTTAPATDATTTAPATALPSHGHGAKTTSGPQLPHLEGVGRPNFVFVLADDWGLGDIGVYNTLMRKRLDMPATPRLDLMAAEGTRFTDFHTLGAGCSPSRASWLTGRSPADPAVRIHFALSSTPEKNAAKGNANYIAPSTPTITSVLSAVGYAVGHFGKWHVGHSAKSVAVDARAPTPAAYGVSTYRCYVCTAETDEQMYDIASHGFAAVSSAMITNDTLAFIDDAVAAGNSFYVNAWIHASHAPLNPSPAQLQRYADYMVGTVDADPLSLCPAKPERQDFGTCPKLVYRASQFEADRQIGRLLDGLVSRGLHTRTLVIFSGDNGPEDPHVYMYAVGDPGPYRGRKRSLYDGGTRQSLLAWWPGVVTAGKVVDAELMSADWLPTAAALAGISSATLEAAAAAAQIGPIMGADRSADFVPSLSPTPPRQTPIAFEYRGEGYGPCWNQAPRFAIIRGGLKLLLNLDRSRYELYNRSGGANPFEADSIAGNPAVAAEQEALEQELLAWVETLDPVTPGTAGANARQAGCAAYQYRVDDRTVDDHGPGQLPSDADLEYAAQDLTMMYEL